MFVRISSCIGFLCLCVLFGTPIAYSAARVALVIGNASYVDAPLRNPVNDANAMATALNDYGFDVVKVVDATNKQMQMAVVKFAGKLGPDVTSVFYYAGHGVQVDGANFLVPVGAELDSELSFSFEALDVRHVLNAMENAGSRLNLVILDACRNNPFERRLRGQSNGLAAIDAASGTLIAYATAPGSVAADGDGKNGLYTEALLGALEEPGLQVEEVFKKVRMQVSNRSAGKQIPWESSSLTGDFILNAAVSNENNQIAKVEGEKNSNGQEVELLFWETIKDSNDAVLYQAYLDKFPTGAFAAIAKVKLVSVGTSGKQSDVNPEEELYWESIKNVGSMELYMTYLERYPNGEFAATARYRLAALSPGGLPPCPNDADTAFGDCYGSRTYGDGSKYTGEFKDGLAHGEGELIQNNGQKFVGLFQQGEAWTGQVYNKSGLATSEMENGRKKQIDTF